MQYITSLITIFNFLYFCSICVWPKGRKEGEKDLIWNSNEIEIGAVISPLLLLLLFRLLARFLILWLSFPHWEMYNYYIFKNLYLYCTANIFNVIFTLFTCVPLSTVISLHRGVFWQFSFWWIHYYVSSKSTRLEIDKSHIYALYCLHLIAAPSTVE